MADDGPSNKRPLTGSDEPADSAATIRAEPVAVPRRQLRTVEHRQSVQYHSGPLPLPETMKGYEAILPGTAERILVMAEKQAAHRQLMELTSLKIEIRGQVFGFIIASVSIVGGLVVIALEKSLIGAAATLTALAGLVGLFIWSKARDIAANLGILRRNDGKDRTAGRDGEGPGA